MTEICWRIVKVYVDGHIWMEKEIGDEDRMLDSLKEYFSEPGIVSITITRQSVRRGGTE